MISGVKNKGRAACTGGPSPGGNAQGGYGSGNYR